MAAPLTSKSQSAKADTGSASGNHSSHPILPHSIPLSSASPAPHYHPSPSPSHQRFQSCYSLTTAPLLHPSLSYSPTPFILSLQCTLHLTASTHSRLSSHHPIPSLNFVFHAPLLHTFFRHHPHTQASPPVSSSLVFSYHISLFRHPSFSFFLTPLQSLHRFAHLQHLHLSSLTYFMSVLIPSSSSSQFFLACYAYVHRFSFYLNPISNPPPVTRTHPSNSYTLTSRNIFRKWSNLSYLLC